MRLQKPLTLGLVLLVAGALLSVSLIACQPQASESTLAAPAPALMQDRGVLHVRAEYYQAQLGLSLVLGGGEFRPLTTTYEWWLDAETPFRFKRVTLEWLEDGPHIVGADGSDGIESWWEVDWIQGMTQTLYHEGLSPRVKGFSFDKWVAIFSLGQPFVAALQRGKAEAIEQFEQWPWGNVLIIRRTDPQSGNVITATVKAEPPHILLYREVVREGKLFETHRLTHWEWLDPATLEEDFWMTPPEGVPIGP